jgi:hypothetical protein
MFIATLFFITLRLLTRRILKDLNFPTKITRKYIGFCLKKISPRNLGDVILQVIERRGGEQETLNSGIRANINRK